MLGSHTTPQKPVSSSHLCLHSLPPPQLASYPTPSFPLHFLLDYKIYSISLYRETHVYPTDPLPFPNLSRFTDCCLIIIYLKACINLYKQMHAIFISLSMGYLSQDNFFLVLSICLQFS